MNVIEVVLVVALALAGVVVGAAVPAILQLRRTLRTAEEFLKSTGARLDRTLDEVSETAARLNRVGHDLEEAARHARSLADEARRWGESVSSLRATVESWATVGAAVGPAIAAAVRAFAAPAEVEESETSTNKEGAHHE